MECQAQTKPAKIGTGNDRRAAGAYLNDRRADTPLETGMLYGLAGRSRSASFPREERMHGAERRENDVFRGVLPLQPRAPAGIPDATLATAACSHLRNGTQEFPAVCMPHTEGAARCWEDVVPTISESAVVRGHRRERRSCGTGGTGVVVPRATGAVEVRGEWWQMLTGGEGISGSDS